MGQNGHAKSNGATGYLKQNREAMRNELARRHVLNDPIVKAEIDKAFAEANEQMDALGESTALAGIVGGDGTFVSANNFFQSPGLTISQNGNTQVAVAKGLTSEDKAVMESQQITESEDASGHNQESTIEPPWNFDILQSLLVTNTIHAAAIETKAADYAYSGWKLNRVPEVTRLIEEGKINEDDLPAVNWVYFI